MSHATDRDDHTPDAAPAPPRDPRRAAFSDARAVLLEAHRAWSEAQRAACDDPWREHEEAGELERLRQEREAALDRFGRLALAWMLRGGRCELLEERSRRPAPTRAADAERGQAVAGAVARGAAQTAAEPEAHDGAREGEQAPAGVAPEPPEQPEASADGTTPAGRAPEAAPPARPERIAQVELGPAWAQATQTTPAPRPEPPPLAGLLEPLRTLPSSIAHTNDAIQELHRLTVAIDGGRTEGWTRHERSVQRALVAHVVARARRLQDELAPGLLPPAVLPELDRVFSCMTAFSKREQPGFVYGLMRSHEPVHATWLADAQSWWSDLSAATGQRVENPERALDALQDAIDDAAATARPTTPDTPEGEAITDAALLALAAGVAPDDPRLVRLMDGHYALLKRHTEFKRLRRAIREARALDQAFQEELARPTDALSEAWPFHPLVHGRQAAVIGGDLRQEARDRLQQTFGFSSLEWVTTDKARHVQSLAESIAGGSIDFVIVLRRFVGHDVDRVVLPACRQHGVPWVSVERGYGANQVRLAIERYLTAPEPLSATA